MNQFPTFDETSQDIPLGYCIEQYEEHEFYAHRVDPEDHTVIYDVLDEDGLSHDYQTRQEALAVIIADAKR